MTLHHISFVYVSFHCVIIAFHYAHFITLSLHFITYIPLRFHYVSLRTFHYVVITFHYVHTITFISLHCITLHCIALHYITMWYVASYTVCNHCLQQFVFIIDQKFSLACDWSKQVTWQNIALPELGDIRENFPFFKLHSLRKRFEK